MLIILVFCLLLLGGALPTRAATYYISPTGNDGASGTAQNAPWKTFAFAIAKLRPGDTLMLLNGTYTAANCGSSGCGQGFVNLTGVKGTATAPITLKAQNERQAWIQENGTYAGINVSSSSYIVVEGLRLSTTDSGRQSEPIWGTRADHLTLRKLLVHNADRKSNAHLIDIQLSNTLLVEDTELYNFHRHGMVLGDTNDSTIRRLYCNPRGWTLQYTPPDAKGPGGDACVAIYPGQRNLIENAIMEDTSVASGHLSEINGVVGSNAGNNRILGSIARGVGRLIRPWSRGYATADMITNDVYEHVVGVDIKEQSLSCIGCNKVRCTNCSSVGGRDGFLVNDPDFATYATPPSATFTNSLAVGGSGTGFRIVGTRGARFNYDNAYQNATNFDPAGSDPRITNKRTVDPKLGTCKVWIPDASPMKRAGEGGADIGATILYRYQNGTLTTTPLWDRPTGQFPCGATVAGLNDTPANSCRGVHQRLNVNTNGCAFPSGYGGGTAQILPPPSNLRLVPTPARQAP